MSFSEVAVGNGAGGGCLLGNWVEEVSAGYQLNISITCGYVCFFYFRSK